MLAGDIRSSAAMSATAVLANPIRRNSVSAVSMIRSRVSSGLVLTCAFIGPGRLLEMIYDDFYNSSLVTCQAPLAARTQCGHDVTMKLNEETIRQLPVPN